MVPVSVPESATLNATNVMLSSLLPSLVRLNGVVVDVTDKKTLEASLIDYERRLRVATEQLLSFSQNTLSFAIVAANLGIAEWHAKSPPLSQPHTPLQPQPPTNQPRPQPSADEAMRTCGPEPGAPPDTSVLAETSPLPFISAPVTVAPGPPPSTSRGDDRNCCPVPVSSPGPHSFSADFSVAINSVSASAAASSPSSSSSSGPSEDRRMLRFSDVFPDEKNVVTDRYREIFALPPAPQRVTMAMLIDRIHPDDRKELVDYINGVAQRMSCQPATAMTTPSTNTRPSITGQLASNEGATSGVRSDNITHHEFRVVMPDGSTQRWVHCSAVTLHEPVTGLPLRYISAMADITEQKQLQLQLKQAAERAERASQVKSQFLSALSHELRSPLNPVMLIISSLLTERRPQLPVDIFDDLTLAESCIKMEVALIDDLLDITRIVSGKLVLQLGPVAMDTLLRESVNLAMEPKLSGKQLHLSLRLSAPFCIGWVDQTRINQVFWNILRNAAKFTPHGGHITVMSQITPVEGTAFHDGNGERSPDNGARAPLPTTDDGTQSVSSVPVYELVPPNFKHRYVVIIRDDGIGMTPETVSRIFHVFEQGDPAITKQFGGLGLGLSIAAHIVQRHGGTVKAHSDGLGKGSTFTVELPCIVLPPTATSTSISQFHNSSTLTTTPSTATAVCTMGTSIPIAVHLEDHVSAQAGTGTGSTPVASSLSSSLVSTPMFRCTVTVRDSGSDARDQVQATVCPASSSSSSLSSSSSSASLSARASPSPSPQPPPPLPPPPLLPPPPPPPTRPLTVLLVDDDSVTLRIMRRIVSSMNLGTLLTAASVADAKRQTQLYSQRDPAFRVDLLISDIGLPDGTGLDVICELHRRYGPGVRGVACSGFGASADIAASLQAGFQSHLVKPITPHALKQAILQATAAIDWHPTPIIMTSRLSDLVPETASSKLRVTLGRIQDI